MKSLVALLLSSVALWAQTNYVSTGGNDGNPGTFASPWLTPNHGVASINSGQTTDLLILDGAYALSGNLTITASGTPTHAIYIGGYSTNTWNATNPVPAAKLSIAFGGNVFNVNEVSNVCIRGLSISGNNSGAIGVSCVGHNNTYQGIEVSHCEVLNTTTMGVYFEGGSSTTFTDQRGYKGAILNTNYIHDCGYMGIQCRDGQTSVGGGYSITPFKNNGLTIIGTCISNIPGGSVNNPCAGMLLQEHTNTYVYNCTILKVGANYSVAGQGGPSGIIFAWSDKGYVGHSIIGHIRANTNPSRGAYDGIGINPGPAARRSTWEDNYVWDCDGGGFMENIQVTDYSGFNVCRFNVFIDCGLLGAEAFGEIEGFKATSFNTIVHNNQFISHSTAARMQWLDTGGQPEYMINNVVITPSGGQPLTEAWGTPASQTYKINGNVYYASGGTVHYTLNGTVFNGLAAWKAATSTQGYDTNSYEQNPALWSTTVLQMTNPIQISITTNWAPQVGQIGVDIQHLYGISPGGFDFNSNALPAGYLSGAYATVTLSDPVITQQPQSVAVFVNSSTNFTVVASGTPTLHYQWKVNGANQGTDSATFTTNTVLAGAQGATVSVVVTGPGINSPQMSADAIIQVLPDPYIQIEPTNYTTVEGGSATFFVGAIGATTLTYAWTVGGISQGGNSPTLTLNNVPFLFNGSAVVCAVSDSNGSTNTLPATLTVNHNGPLPPYTGDAVNFTIVSALRTNGVGPVQGWIDYDVSFYPITELNTNFDATRAYGEIAWFTFPISTSGGQPFGPQTYKIYIGQATQTTNSTVIARIGDGWVTNTFGPTDAWNTWTNLPNVTSSISFSNVLIGVMKRNPVGILQNYWLAGVGVLQTNYDTISPGVYRFINTNAIVTTNLAGAPGNLVPNSSFEFGLAPGGWTSGRNGTIGNETWLANMTTNDAFNGSKAAVIGDGLNASRFQIISPPIWLRGDRNIRSYVLSFYYKKGPGGPASATVDWARPYSSADSGAANFTPTGAYQRFQTNLWLAPFPNRLFGFTIHHVATGPLMIDAVQFEESTNGATAYAPANQIELAIACRDINSSTWHNGNVVDSISMTPGFGFQVYNNTASSSNITGHVNIYDWLNRNVGVGTFSHTAAPGLTEFYSGTFTAAGENRIYAYIDGSPAFRTEADFAYVPVPNPATTNWASMFGTHACQDNTLVASNLTWGISWQRGLSPGGIVQMNEIEAVSNVFDFASTDIKVNAALAGGKCVLLANMSDVSDIPAWALDGSGIPFLQPLSNFAYQVVNHYKTQIHHWESINEPMTPSGWSGATFATIETALSGAVKLADPTAIYVGFGGIGGGTDISKAETAWTAMNAGTHAQIDAVSTHMYPANSALWMGPDDDPRPAAARALGIFCSKPVWNTESGSYHWPNHGDKNGGLQGIPSYANHNEEFEYRRSVYQAAELAARNWIRLLGYGIQKYFYYDGRLAGGTYSTETGLPTWFDYDDSMGPVGTAYLWSQHFLDLPSYVQSMTNTATSDVFGALFAHNGGQQVIAAFTLSRSNLVMTVTNNSFAVYDMMGGLLQTNVSVVAIGRTPTYWVSSDLTSNQLTATFQSASVVSSINTVAPAISIDVSQHGNILQTNQLPFRFRWTTISPYDINTDDTPLIVLTRYRFAGITDWTSWSADRYVEMTNAPSTLTHLEVQAMDAQGNLSGTVSGPDFGPGTGPIAPYNFHVSKGHVSSGHL